MSRECRYWLNEAGEDLEDYDSVAAAAETCQAITRVLQSPIVDANFKQRVWVFAEARRDDLVGLGYDKATAVYEAVIELDEGNHQ